jgi:hypothetical protein
MSEPKRLDWQHWGLWLFLAAIPAVAVWRSGLQLFPEASEHIFFIGVTTLGVSFLWHTLIITDDPRMAQAGVRAIAALCIALIANWGCHLGLSRDLSMATHSKIEKTADETRQHQQRLELADKEKELSAARAAESKAATGLLTQLPMSRRGNVKLPSAQNPVMMANTPAPSPTPATQAMQTPDQIRASWLWWVGLMAFLDLGVTLLCAFSVVYIRYYQDGNGNNIPDTAEREAKRLSPEQFATQYPRWFEQYGRTLYPMPQGAMGKA